MSVPVEIEGKSYFVTLPALPDFRMFGEYFREQLRRRLAAAIPHGLPDSEFKRWLRTIDEECEAIDGFDCLFKLLGSQTDADFPKRASLLFYSLLRQENSGITLDWVEQFVARAEAGRPESLAGLHALNDAFGRLWLAKKNEFAATLSRSNGNPLRKGRRTSTKSTSR